MSAVGVIPARFRASRFPGKPLAPIAGRPMLQHVIEGARRAKRLREVLVATDDARIAEAAAALGAPVVMTSADHPTGTDRLAEAAASFADAIVVNIQGDEPLIEGFVIDAAVEALEADAGAVASTVVHPLEPGALDDPNRVKVVLDRHGRALYFSRSRIPALRDAKAAPRYWQHVGLYAYRRRFLLDFVKLERTPLEKAEALEQLRALEHGYRIRTVETKYDSVGVDTPEDLERVRRHLLEVPTRKRTTDAAT